LADKVFHETGPGVAVCGGIVFFEDLVGEFGAGFEGEFFAEDERVVAVEEDFFDLSWGGKMLVVGAGGGGEGAYGRHCYLASSGRDGEGLYDGLCMIGV
jgi:hypothetical protein